MRFGNSLGSAVDSGRVDLSNVSRFRNRGDLFRYSMSSADLDFLVREYCGLVSGVDAAAGYGEGIPVVLHEANLYLSSSRPSILISWWT